MEALILQEGAKLNLTNRQGFEYQGLQSQRAETVYVKDLVLGPHAVLNTALQTLYYQRLLDPDGRELTRDHDAPYAPLANGARFEDIPLLGFSLGVIAMDDLKPAPHNEFDVRVRRRLVDDPNMPSPPGVGSIRLVRDDPAIPTGSGGVMVMQTQAPESLSSAGSVAAKGAFARAGREDITIQFEYLFLEDGGGEAQIVVYLSDHSEVGQRRVEVARVSPPPAGAPGSIGSNRFGVFDGTFTKGSLNFTRGTYVELELRGRDVRCWIDNWDPQIYCSTCGDYSGDGGLDVVDYCLLLTEMGLARPSRVPGATGSKNCLDLTRDGCVTLDDLLAWDAHESVGESVCPWGPGSPPEEPGSSATATLAIRSSGPRVSGTEVRGSASGSSLAVLAKPLAYSVKSSSLFDLDVQGVVTQGQGVVGTGRLATRAEGSLYQVDPNGTIRLLRLASGDSGRDVLLGRSLQAPLNDVALHPTQSDILYVTPLWIGPELGGHKAAAKIRVTPEGKGEILRYYEIPPAERSHVASDPNVTRDLKDNPDKCHPCEIEVDPTGRYVFVLSRCLTNQDNWLLVYAESEGSHPVAEVRLNNPADTSPDVEGPSCMLLSASGRGLYLTSSIRDPAGPAEGDLALSLYVYGVDYAGDSVTLSSLPPIVLPAPTPAATSWDPWCIPGSFVSMLTSMTEDPKTGRLYAVGYVAPRFDRDAIWGSKERSRVAALGLFTVPMLISIDPQTRAVAPVKLSGAAGQMLGLPLSVVWTGSE